MPHKTDLDTLLSTAKEHSLRFLASLDKRPVFPTATYDQIRGLFDVPLPAKGEDPKSVLEELAAAGEKSAVASPGPRYFGYVIGGTVPASIAADWLTSAWDQNAGLWSATPAASAVEEVVARWLLDLLGLPDRSGVGFVTGCQMANFTCLAAARHSVLRRAGWDVENDGLNGAPAIHVVASAEAHVTIHGALKMLGIGTSAITPIECDDQGRMRVSKLEAAIADLEGPMIICTQAGNVNTGSFDPIHEIVAAAKPKHAWVHVDGAFGLWAAVSSRRRHLVEGFENADSWATDAHKWLNVPYDSGIAIIAHPDDQFGSMSLKAEYLEKGVDREPLDWVPEFSRRARGFPLWTAIRVLGREGLEAMIDRGCDLAARAAEKLGAVAGIEVLTKPVVNQALFRFHGSDALKDDELTREVIRRVQDERVCWLSGTRWHDMESMRFSVSNWSTAPDDVDRSVDSIVRCFEAAKARSR